MTRLRVVIADDQPMMRAGFKAVLEATGDIAGRRRGRHRHRGGRGGEAPRPGRRADGHPHARDGRHRGDPPDCPRQRVLILTTFGLDDYIIAALRAGASGFLLKDAPTADVVAAVRAVAAGDAVLSPAITRQLLDQVGRRLPAAVSREPEELSRSSPTASARSCGMLAAGLTNAEIAAALVVSEATVKIARLQPARQARAA